MARQNTAADPQKQDTKPAPFNLGDHVRYVGAQERTLSAGNGVAAEKVLVRGMMGDYFAWFLLLIAAPVALLLSVIAFPINVFLLISLISVLLGKAPPKRTSPTNPFGTLVRTVRQKENRYRTRTGR